MIARDFKDEKAERLSYDELKQRYPDNRLLHVIAFANVRRGMDYRCVVEGVPTIVLSLRKRSDTCGR